ncbi:MAG: hypothetical protein ACE1Z2_07435 [Acidobacteriota bacterium]|nr:hypothetical protein [Acidobacteriota bacterium]TDI08515.1 MAG: hypothetical protein E2P08_04415 [Acidobacteriota bacterium]
MWTHNNLLIDILGWIGAIGLLAAYVLISAKKVEGDSTSYQLLNLVGSFFLILNTLYYGAYPSSFLNLFWIAVALYALRKVIGKYFLWAR